MNDPVNVIWYRSMPTSNFRMDIGVPWSKDYWLGVYHIVNAYERNQRLRMRVEVLTNSYLRLVGEYSGFTMRKIGTEYVMNYETFETNCKYDLNAIAATADSNIKISKNSFWSM